MNLSDHRKAIDQFDANIVKLLNERTRHVLAIGEIKLKAGEEIYAPHRERAVFDRVCGHNAGPEVPFPDACEPPGDRLVATGVDLEIVRVHRDETADEAQLEVDGDLPTTPLGTVTIRRGAVLFDATARGVKVRRVATRTLAAQRAE